MPTITEIFIPILFGLILITTILRGIIFWQMERTPKVFAFFMVFLCFCLLYLVLALAPYPQWQQAFRDSVRLVLLTSLVVGNWFQLVELRSFLAEKNRKRFPGVDAVHVEAEPPPTKTLAALAGEQGPVKLEATEITEGS